MYFVLIVKYNIFNVPEKVYQEVKKIVLIIISFLVVQYLMISDSS